MHQFRRHPELKDMHAFLSPSKKSWVNYDDDKLFEAYSTHRAAALGTRKHALANELILLGQKLPDTTQTLNMYVNDCISLFMHPEVPLAYSENAFGTADAINYVEEHSLLRIFDYKSGFTAVTDTQLDIYGALFCLEYKKRPGELAFDFRIYQNDSVIEYQTDHEIIAYIMDKIVSHDRLIKKFREEGATW